MVHDPRKLKKAESNKNMCGGYKYEIAGAVLPDLLCCICLKLMKNAMQLECGHGMCQSCLEDLEKNCKKSRQKYCCPRCQVKIQNECVTHAAIINRIISTTKVKCENVKKECPWVGELSNIQHHLEKECCFQIVNCTFEHCQEKMERHTLSIHGEICGYKPVTCEYCSIICLKLDIANHHGACEKYPVPCPNECSANKMERQTVEDHRTICTKENISCEFLTFGCNFETARGNMPAHDNNASQYHLSLTLKMVNEMKVGIQNMTVGILAANRTIEILRNEIAKATKRAMEEQKWYKDKLLDLIQIKINKKNVISKYFAPPFEESLKHFDENFGLFTKGLPFLTTELNEIGEIKDDAYRKRFEAFSEEVIKVAERCLLEMKKDNFVFEFNYEAAINEIKERLPTIFYESQERHIESVLECEKRFRSMLNKMKSNTEHSCQESQFYKIDLNWITLPCDKSALKMGNFKNGLVKFEDALMQCFVDVNSDSEEILHIRFLSKNIKEISCVFYNLKMEEKGFYFTMFNPHKEIEVAELRNQEFVMDDQVLVRFTPPNIRRTQFDM